MMARLNTKRRLKDKEYDDKHRATVRINTRRHLAENRLYATKNRTAAKTNIKRRWETDDKYRQKKNKITREKLKQRWRTDSKYRQKKQANRTSQTRSTTLTVQQRYWRRRARMLVAEKERHINHALKQKMAQQSHISSLDCDMIFTRANKIEKTTKTLKDHHMKLAKYVSAALENTANKSSV